MSNTRQVLERAFLISSKCAKILQKEPTVTLGKRKANTMCAVSVTRHSRLAASFAPLVW